MVVFALLGLWKEIWATMAKVPGAMKSGWARLVGWLGEARKALREARTKVRAWKAWDEARSSLKGAPSKMEVAWTAVIEWVAGPWRPSPQAQPESIQLTPV